MPEAIKPFLDFISHLFDLVFTKIGIVPQSVSAIILLSIVAVLLGLLIYFSVVFTRVVKGREADPDIEVESHVQATDKSKIELVAENGRLKKRLATANADIEEMTTNPTYTRTEKIYFAVNGITNSALILGIGILLYAYVRLHYLHVASPSTEVAVERIMGVLASTIVVSGFLVWRSLKDKGRSFERINQSFQISFAIAVVAFFVFVTYVLPI